MDYYLSHYSTLLQACLLFFKIHILFLEGVSAKQSHTCHPDLGNILLTWWSTTRIYPQHQASPCIPHSLKSLPLHRGAFHSTSAGISSFSLTLMIWLCVTASEIFLGCLVFLCSYHWLHHHLWWPWISLLLASGLTGQIWPKDHMMILWGRIKVQKFFSQLQKCQPVTTKTGLSIP